MNTETLTIETSCPFCGDKSNVVVPKKAWDEYELGHRMIQDVLKMLTPDEREKLMTGICEKCFPSEPTSESEY